LLDGVNLCGTLGDVPQGLPISAMKNDSGIETGGFYVQTDAQRKEVGQ
jgi:hypothetical protein